MIKLAQDTIDAQDLLKLSEWLKTNPKLTKGDLVMQFEDLFAAKMGMKFGVMVNSGSSANLLVLQAMINCGKLQKGDRVVIPAISWATDLAPVIQLGLVPIICDVDLKNIGVDTVKLESILVKYMPKSIMLVSVLGMPPDMQEIMYLCDKHNCIVVEDFCESLGSRSDDKLIGSFGFASTTSLYFGHHISTIEGGMIFTNDIDFRDHLLMARSHGWDRDLDDFKKTYLQQENFISRFDTQYTFYVPGFNFRPTEINAFLGLLQLEKIDSLVALRKKIFDYYNYAIDNNYWKPVIPKDDYVSNLGYPLIHPKRYKIIEALKDICETRPFVSGNMALQPMYKKYILENPDTPQMETTRADMIHKFGMYLPNHPFLKEQELYSICKCVNSIIGQ